MPRRRATSISSSSTTAMPKIVGHGTISVTVIFPSTPARRQWSAARNNGFSAAPAHGTGPAATAKTAFPAVKPSTSCQVYGARSST